jgi:hypothetical protein
MATSKQLVASMFEIIDSLKVSPRATVALRSIVCKRGKAAGYFLRHKPKGNGDDVAAWLGVMAACNPYKLSVAALLFMHEDQREIYREVEARFNNINSVYRAEIFDLDRRNLEAMGVY